MATFQQREGRWRAIVRRQGQKAKSKTFATKSMAKVWADRAEREMEELEARGKAPLDGATLSDVIAWYKDAVGRMKVLSATHKGNLTRIREGLGQKIACRISAADVIEHAQRRCQGEHVIAGGVKIPACGPATMNVELSYLADVLKAAQSMGKLTLVRDPVAEARPFLRRMKLVAKSRNRDRRPSADELAALHRHFSKTAWRSQIPMSEIVEFAIATAKRESEITTPAQRRSFLRCYKVTADGKFFTSAGISSGINLALLLIEQAMGNRIALAVAREMVDYLRRPGGQSQFSEPLRFQTRASDRFAELAAWIATHLKDDLSVDALSDRVCLSPRQFRRCFVETFDCTPAAFVQELRMTEARIRLIASGAPIDRIAASVGFSSADVFSRAFQRKFGVSPADYRRGFGSTRNASALGQRQHHQETTH